MLNFFRDHSRVITKLITNQFGAAFLAIALALPTAQLNSKLFLATSIFAVLFLIYLDYTVVWEEGAKSRIRVDAGREKYNPMTGFWLGAAASIPNLLFGLLTAVFFFFSNVNGPFAWEWAGNVCGVTMLIAHVWQAMYIGIIQFFFEGSKYIYLLIPFPVILGCLGGYWLGLNNHRLFALTVKKQEKKTSAK